MNAKDMKDALLRSVDAANEHHTQRAATSPTYASYSADSRRLVRAEFLLSYFIASVEESEPALASALRDFMRISEELTDQELADKRLAVGERFSRPAPEPVKPARR